MQYAILRNYDFLLEGRTELRPEEKSIDMAVAGKDKEPLEAVLKQHGFLRRLPQFSLAHQAYFRIDKEIVSFDIQFGGVHWNDMCYLDEKYLLANRIKKDFFYAPSISDRYIMLLLHSLLGKRRFKPEYREFLEQHKEQAANPYVLERAAGIFGVALARQMMHDAGHCKFQALVRKKYYYISYFIFSSWKRMGIFFPLILRWLRWKRPFSPYPLVSFIGPDGAGKSTLAQGLQPYLAAQGRRAAIVYTGRGKGQLLPVRRIGNLYKSQERKKDAARHAEKTPADKPGRKLLYSLWSLVTAADLALRYAFLIFPRRRFRRWVITDRYTSDLLLMEHVPVRLKKFLASFFPLPTITFYVYQDAEVLHERRPAESLEGLQKQLRQFEEIRQRMGALGSITIRIRTEDKEQSARQVQERVMEYAYRNWV